MLRTATIAALVCLTALITLAPLDARAQAPDTERIAASFLLGLGRPATTQELEGWSAQMTVSLSALVARHREQLRADPAAERAVIEKSVQDAFGIVADAAQVKTLSGTGAYLDLMRRHLSHLAQRPADYEQVLHRAYRLTLARDAYPVEIEYWKGRPPLSFALLAGCIEDWGRRNQPGLTATTGIPAVSLNSTYLVTARLSPATMSDARQLAGLAEASDEALAAAAGQMVAAPGARGLVSVGGIPFVAAGASNLVVK